MEVVANRSATFYGGVTGVSSACDPRQPALKSGFRFSANAAIPSR